MDPLENYQEPLLPVAPPLARSADAQDQGLLGTTIFTARGDLEITDEHINKIAQFMGIQRDAQIDNIGINQYEEFIQNSTDRLLNAYYPENEPNHQLVRENMHTDIRNAFQRNILAAEPNVGTLINLHGESLLVVTRSANPIEVEPFRFTANHFLAEGTHAVVDHISRVGQEQLRVLKMAKLGEGGAIRERSEADIQAHTNILNQIALMRNEDGYPENIEPLPYAIVTTLDGAHHGYIPAEKYAGDMGKYEGEDPKITIDRSMQVISGLRTLDEVGLRWGDNKLGNIFITQGDSPQLHLGDFGGAQFYDQLHLPELQAILHEDVVSALDIIQVMHTSQYLTTPHLNRFIEAVMNPDAAAYQAAHMQMELFCNGAMLFELLTDMAIDDLVDSDEDPPIEISQPLLLNPDLMGRIEETIEALPGDNWEDVLNNALSEDGYVVGENITFYPPNDENGEGWTAWLQDPADAGHWFQCQHDGNQWQLLVTVERGNQHFQLSNDEQSPLNGNYVKKELSRSFFNLPYEQLAQNQRGAIDTLHDLFQRACSPNPPADFAIDNADFLNQMRTALTLVQEILAEQQ